MTGGEGASNDTPRISKSVKSFSLHATPLTLILVQ